MKDLLTGYAVTVVALATIDGVSNTIAALFEYAKNSINLATARKQVEINKLAQQKQNEHVRAIGFTTDSNAEEDDEYDD